MYIREELRNIEQNKKFNLYRDRVIQEIRKMKSSINDDTYAPFNIVYNDGYIREIKNIKEKEIERNFSHVLVCGVGGSSIGAKTLTESMCIKNVTFLESIDSSTVSRTLDGLDLDDTMFLFVSKSGQTIEVVVNSLIIIELLERRKIKVSERVYFVTENKESTVTSIARHYNCKIFEHPSKIGGRYSYLSIVGLLPALLGGLNIDLIMKGAKYALEYVLNEKDSVFIDVLAWQLYLTEEEHVSMNVLMIYIDSLKSFNEWYRQLLAESIGKGGKGLTPVDAIGTQDQHSQLQLYLDGPKNKFFTFITKRDICSNFEIKCDLDISYKIDRKYLGEIMKIEQDSTIEVLSRNDKPVRNLEIQEFDEESVSVLMMKMMLEVVLLCRCLDINPFDQPAVELRKIISRKELM